MLFNSLIFLFGFLPIVYAGFWLLRGSQSRYIWLTLAGYVFYGYWDPRYCLLMAFSTMVSYIAGRLMLTARERGRLNRWHLIVPITVDLCLLGYFKYAGFACRSLNDALAAFGFHTQLPVLDIVLPIGISFYTFHTISYIVDGYRGVITPTKNIFEFSTYVSLFSQLVAGPIVRFRQIEKDLEAVGQADYRKWFAIGVSFFVFGLVEKVLLADSLSTYVSPVFDHPQGVGVIQTWTALLAYSFQLYFDFCGYSTMAVGLGYLFGIRIPQNFNSPYKSHDPSDFWRRWHISLSSCLRDYLYIALGGNRGGTWATYRNLMLTMLIGGLWHGANWTFIIWGAYHGLLLVVYRLTASFWERLPAHCAQALMFFLAILGWVPFRAATLTDTVTLSENLLGANGIGVFTAGFTAAALLGIAAWWSMVGPNAFDFHLNYRWRARQLLWLAPAFGAALAMIVGGGDSPFLYFQF
jgi:alginate O-acetyltransferase complex protein AlgI